MENNFEKYIDTINTTLHTLSDTLKSLDDGIAKTRTDIDGKKRYGTVSPAKMEVYREELAEAERAYRENCVAAADKARREAQEARQSLERELAQFTLADPSSLDSASLSLLNSGIMRDDDLVNLALKNAQNPTMLRLVAAQAKTLDTPTANDLMAHIAVYVSPDSRLRVFDVAVANAHFTGDSRFLSIAVDAWDERIYKEVRDDMQQLNSFTFQEG